MNANIPLDGDVSAVMAGQAKPEVKTGRKWGLIIREQLQFALCKAIDSRLSHIVHGTTAVTIDTGANGMLRQIRVTKRGKLLGTLDYFAASDEVGAQRGGHPASSYLHDLIANKGLNEARKLRVVRQLIAQLPGNVSFGLAAAPHASDIEMLKKAFGGAGFKIWRQETFVYSPPTDGSDLIASMKGTRIKSMLRAAQRDLDVIEISPAELVRFYASNLELTGRHNYCSPAIDVALLTDCLGRNPPQARVIAARLKPTEENPDPTRIEAAVALTWGEDRLCKLLRVTYHPDAHQHGTKLLILEGAATAARYGKQLDTDAATAGGKELYRRFGSFTEHTRHEFVRYPMRRYVQKSFPSIARRLGLYATPAEPVA